MTHAPQAGFQFHMCNRHRLPPTIPLDIRNAIQNGTAFVENVALGSFECNHVPTTFCTMRAAADHGAHCAEQDGEKRGSNQQLDLCPTALLNQPAREFSRSNLVP